MAHEDENHVRKRGKWNYGNGYSRSGIKMSRITSLVRFDESLLSVAVPVAGVRLGVEDLETSWVMMGIMALVVRRGPREGTTMTTSRQRLARKRVL